MSLCAALALLALHDTTAPRVAYEIRYEPEPAPGALEVDVRIEDARAGGLVMVLEPFGEWPEAEHVYLLGVRGEPALHPYRRGDALFSFALPKRWDGAAHLSYRIPLLDADTPAGRRYGLLPRRAGTLIEANAINVLPTVFLDGLPSRVPATVALRGPDDLVWVTGWADPARGALDVEIERVDQCPIYLHPSPRTLADGEGDRRIVVAQLNEEEDVREDVLALVRAVLDASERATGVPRGGVQRVFVRGRDPHASGGMRTDHGVVLAWNPSTADPTVRHGLAHELFHEWLPGKLPARERSRVWLFEGFTQYLSLLIAARGGVLDADAFAERMLEVEAAARSSSAFGKLAFGDDDVAWRDGDGPRERLAYDGGALLAFHIDLALREGGTTLAAELGRWMLAAEPGYSLARLREALERAGASDAYASLVDRPLDPPPVEETLEGLGFFDREVPQEAPVTYLGVETDAGLGPGRVLAIDPDGPQATRDLRVGDVILDYGPRRTGLTLAEGRDPGRFACGLLDLLPFRQEGGWWAEIERDGERRRVEIEPWLQPGGVQRVRRADPERAKAFLERT